MQPIHMQLSQKLRTFSRFFSAFSQSRLNFEYFQKNNDAHSLFISETTACKRRGYISVLKSHLRLPFQKEHGKRVSTLFKSELQHLRHIYCSTGWQFSGKKSVFVT